VTFHPKPCLWPHVALIAQALVSGAAGQDFDSKILTVSFIRDALAGG